ncbi:MAG: pre-peptidase C-terminal domain-containing protein [Giesbergeria sp.]|uniref:InlB B-repeat-containing protein n=1 Tax=Giesbergeria sp. TaxID=2818473 RepID=UPI002632B1E5|nr:pre-peptidase C-terminal domain-containing protein [Giesbergeria sp.]MDD2608681.1 pre-peptidase C-terminal domain-containing protein [Giesbergeria sp.]
MVFLSVRNRLAALLLGVALFAPAIAQTVLELPVAQTPGMDVRQALTVPPGGMLRLERLPLDNQSGELASANLRRTNTDETTPLLVEHSGTKVTTMRPAPRTHFTGQLVGDPKSNVFVSIDSQGNTRSIVRRGEEVFVSDMSAAYAATGASATPGTAASPPALHSRRVDFTADAPSEPFVCGVNSEFTKKHYIPPSAALLENIHNNQMRAGLIGVASQGAEALGAQRRANIIVETDYELFQRLGSSAAVHAYVTDLMGYVSSQYETEVGARLNVTQINVYTSPADPWTGSSTSTLLTELKNHWNASSRIGQPRHHVHLLSARNAGGGQAYLNTLADDQKTYAYGVTANIDGGFSASNPRVVWDALGIAHEIGHAFGSSHTHEFDEPYLGSNQGGAIDCCYSDEVGSQCAIQLGGASRSGVLPGIGSTTGGSSGTGVGTIMSYCHTLRSGNSNISFNFGTNHVWGVSPWRVASVLQSSAETHLPLDGAAQDYMLTVSRQGTGSGTVTSTPAGIQCGSSCSTNYSAGTQVTLTAQPASGSTFTGWGGACSGTSSCTVSMNSARSVTANFTAAVASTRLVMLSKSGTGTGVVTSSPSGLICADGCGSASANFATTTAITLTAMPYSGSTFAGWGGICSGTGSCTVPAGISSASVTASFNSTNTNARPFTLNKAGSGTGSVTITPPGTTCDPSCTRSWPVIAKTAVISLVAQASAGSTFAGWSGACSGTGSCTIAAGSSAIEVTASFNATTATTRTITLNKSGNAMGIVTSSPTGLSCGVGCNTASGNFSRSSAITLSAVIPYSNITFSGWSGACSGTGSCIIPAGATNASVTASFNTSTSTVTALQKINLGGAVNSSQNFSVAVPSGATNLKIQTSGEIGDADLYVRFAQVPNTTTYDCRPFFLGSNEVCNIPAPTAGTYHILIKGYQAFSGLTLTASYQTATAQNYALTVSRQGTGSGIVTSTPAGINCGSTCSASYLAGTQVTLAAQPTSGSAFTGWGGACSGTSSCIVRMENIRSVTANFTQAANNRLVTLSKSGMGVVTSSPSGLNCAADCSSTSANFVSTTAITLTALPQSGSTFTGWGGICSGMGSCTIPAGTSNANVIANFKTSGGGRTINGLQKNNLVGTAGSLQYFSVAVPLNATNLKIETSGGTGDADLYVRFAQMPNTTAYDCRPFYYGNNEICNIFSPTAGTYHILLKADQAFSGLNLSASYQIAE